MSNEVVDLIAKKFIQRRDVKAVQKILQDGTVLYTPDGVREKDGTYSSYRPWNRSALESHVAGDTSYGHYLLDTSDNVKLFAFDIDLEKIGYLPTDEGWENFAPCGPRDVWLDRTFVHERSYLKYQFKTLAHMLMRAIESELELPSAAAYSGHKGIHVYGFTGSCPAADAREAAMIVLDSLDRFQPSRGSNFFMDKDDNPQTGFQNLSIELFPKQNSLEGKDLGNLMRLPLGKNLKNPKDPTFFIDMTSPMAVMRPVDPVQALTCTSPFLGANEA